jgi:predicted nucleic acid-binding Zn ribbon protein
MNERPVGSSNDDPTSQKRRKQAAAADHTIEIDAAQAALNRMRRIAKSRGELRIPRSRLGEKSVPKAKRKPFLDAKYGGGRDPQGLGNVVSRLVSDRGWSSPLAVGSVMAQWDTLVGPDIAAHCQPESFEATTLHVRCDSTSWATQLRLLASSLLAKFDENLGLGVVTKILVLGPAAPSWRKGFRNVKGRGPRDTYG